MKKVKWGILGSGKIATIFSTALQNVENAQIYAVASRNIQEKESHGETFAAQFNCEHCYEGFDLLLEDKDVDIIYIALPHSVHKEFVMKALTHNKNVLCEKPLGINENEVCDMISLAKEKELFLMEGMWTRFLPVTKKVNEIIKEGVIGDVKLVRAEFGFPAPGGKESRFKNPMLAGGALLDVGIYTIAYVQMILGEKPLKMISMPFIGESNVDYSASVIMDYGNGVRGEVSMSFEGFLANQAIISGDKGIIIVDQFYGAQNAKVITQYGQKCEEINIPHEYNGYEYQARKVTQCILDGDTECDEFTLKESQEIAGIMDSLRADWGLSYPMENIESKEVNNDDNQSNT